MEFWPCCWCRFLWMVVFLLKNVSANSSSHTKYTLSQREARFDQAVTACLPGTLPSVATEHEYQEISQLLSKSKLYQANITVWIGLRKPKSECVVPSLPLRGFKWVENGSQEASVINWLEEPALTCTEDLCGALKRQVVQSKVHLVLIPDSCKTPYRFICKVRHAGTSHSGTSHAGTSVKSSQTTIRPVSVKPQKVAATAKTTPTTLIPHPTTPHLHLPAGPESCEHSKNPKHPSIRSLTPDSSNDSRVLVECWSEVKIELVCSGTPAVWRLLDGSLADFSSICLHCDTGFQKNDSGLCVDVDECSTGKPCPHTCQNTEGSYRCVCGDDPDSSCEETGGKSSMLHILIPVVAVVVVLLVILAIIVVVTCCLKRRKKTKP
ncbi:C-type lectin domain family 14 member A [Fundulus heteroclitus]|uniref:C-type lectin domain family 14 member A n=1 Tax=Fundulus heteroclitus TaxID=8078 RepID=UPI00165C847F|nr:C-type lectin domain family 14 member A [Fundulus heteroclitus]XP_036006932.1 C-type lectin domain family 14 member A [Fundulus heteroclitus]